MFPWSQWSHSPVTACTLLIPSLCSPCHVHYRTGPSERLPVLLMPWKSARAFSVTLSCRHSLSYMDVLEEGPFWPCVVDYKVLPVHIMPHPLLPIVVFNFLMDMHSRPHQSWFKAFLTSLGSLLAQMILPHVVRWILPCPSNSWSSKGGPWT